VSKAFVNKTARLARQQRCGWPGGWHTKAIAWVAAAGLVGCTLGPDYKRPELPPTGTWRAELPSGADLANTAWWQAFGDADLDAYIDTALDANKDLILASYRIEQFDSRLQISRAAAYPQVGYAGAAGRERRSEERPNGLPPGASPIVNNYELGGNFSWELDLWGKVRRSNEAARADLLSTQEGRRGVMLTVVSSVATSYVQLLELDQQLAIAQQSLSNRREALTLADTRYKGGSGTRLSVEQARVELETVAAALPLIERDIATVENALSGLLGRNPGSIKRRRLDALAVPQMPQGVPADVLTRRPDVMAAEQNLVAANARIGVAKTEYFPTLSLTAALGLGADTPHWLWAETARTGSFGAGLVGPIFSGGRIEGDIRQAEAIQKQMEVLYQLAVQNALKEVEDALVTRDKSGAREATLGRQVDAQQEVTKLARLRYEGGQSTFMEVLNADLVLYSAQGRQAQSRGATLAALVSVYKAMGGGWMVEQEKLRAPSTPAPEVQVRTATEAEAQR
jgi:multidrug efflux system outer membrane protein